MGFRLEEEEGDGDEDEWFVKGLGMKMRGCWRMV